jgi:hypothetical protein
MKMVALAVIVTVIVAVVYRYVRNWKKDFDSESKRLWDGYRNKLDERSDK